MADAQTSQALEFLAAVHDEENDLNTHTTLNIGKRALVTGASSGVGAAIAHELAALGVDLVLTARRRDALDAVAATCKGVKIEVVTADLGKPDAARAVGRRDRQRPDRHPDQQRRVRLFPPVRRGRLGARRGARSTRHDLTGRARAVLR